MFLSSEIIKEWQHTICFFILYTCYQQRVCWHIKRSLEVLLQAKNKCRPSLICHVRQICFSVLWNSYITWYYKKNKSSINYFTFFITCCKGLWFIYTVFHNLSKFKIIIAIVKNPDTNPSAFTYPIKPQLNSLLCRCVCVWDAPLNTRRGRGMLMVFKMERGGPLVPLWDRCCYRNTKCEIQSHAKAKLYIGRPQTPWEPNMLWVCVGVFKYL